MSRGFEAAGAPAPATLILGSARSHGNTRLLAGAVLELLPGARLVDLNEYKRRQAENTDVAAAYILLMGRAPTTAESTDWVNRQQAGTPNVDLLLELLASSKYASHIAG